MDRIWFLTNTMYGNWLPGDSRGFIGHVWEHRDEDDENDVRVMHNQPGVTYDEGLARLEATARDQMKGDPITLVHEHAIALRNQFEETSRYRGWHIFTGAIMFNHFHLVVGVNGDPKPGKILGDFKSWGTRKLSSVYGTPRSKTWWTEKGSKRKPKYENGVRRVITYVFREQPNPLVVWISEEGLKYLEQS